MGLLEFFRQATRKLAFSRSSLGTESTVTVADRASDAKPSGPLRNGTATQLYSMALLLIKHGKPDEAIGFSEQALAKEPQNPEFMLTHARALRRLGRFEDALPLVESLYAKKKKDVFASAEYCKLLVDMRRMGDADVVFRELEKWFKPLSGKARFKHSGMTRAFKEAHEKLRHASRA
jgi:tetratricopeptide (TPR) repeat protein